ncbi:MAG: VOC family protein [Bacillota bacterium]|nr:VOC family protein [Bacillota bacterium]
MKKIIPNITIDNCKEAIEFYKDVFGGQIKNLQLADGKEMFKGHEGKIVHAELVINEDCIIYMNDSLGGISTAGNISLLLQLEGQDEINNLYSKLSKGAKITYELQKTFWGSYHAVLTDSYGTNWQLDYAVR